MALHVEAVALAPAAGERAIDVDVDAEIGALRADLVGRDHVIDQRLDEGGLVEIEEGIAGRLAGAAGAGCWACAVSGVATAAVPPAAAAPPTTAPLRKSRRSSSCFVMVPSLLPGYPDADPEDLLLGGSMLLLGLPGKAASG